MTGKELGNYHILEMIGKGGMAVVYKGQHKTLSRRVVAIKMLSASLEGDASFNERFYREAEVMDRLRHPNIVTLYDFMESEGHYYIVMEYVDGKTLSDIIKEAGGPLSNEEVKAIFQQVLSGIGHAHSVGIVHRDMKPGNIMINEQGEVKITDFGIARLLGNNFEATLTTTGLGIGSPYYMSPEQVLASKEHPITAASDIYSLGITLYQVVTGRLPFEGEDSLFTIMQSHVKKPPLPPREILPAIPAPLEEVILKSIQKKPEDRWPSCEAFWEALSKGLAEPPVTGKKTQTLRTAPLDAKPDEATGEAGASKKKNWVAMLVVLLLFVAGAGAGAFYFLKNQKEPSKIATSEPAPAVQTPDAKEVQTATPEKLSVPPEKKPALPEKEVVDKQKVAVPPATVDKTRASDARKKQLEAEKKRAELERKKALEAEKEKERKAAQAKAQKEKRARKKKQRGIADHKNAQAKAHFEAGRYRQAVQETQDVLKVYPDDPDALAMKQKLENLAQRTLERRRRIEMALQQAEGALEERRYTRAKLIAQQVLDVEPENKRAKRVVQAANDGEENQVLQGIVKGFLPSGGDQGMPSSPQDLPNQSGDGQMPSLPLPGLPQGLPGQ